MQRVKITIDAAVIQLVLNRKVEHKKYINVIINTSLKFRLKIVEGDIVKEDEIPPFVTPEMMEKIIYWSKFYLVNDGRKNKGSEK